MGRADADVPPEVAVGRYVAAAVGAEHSAVVVAAGPGFQGVARGSDPALVALVDMTESVGEGPTDEVLRTGAPLAVDDLHDPTTGWPLLLSTYRVPEEVRALVVLPLDGGPGVGAESPEDVVGLLLLARERPEPLSARAFTTAVKGAALLAGMVMARAEGDGGDVDLDDLLDPRVDVVPRALGVLAQARGLSQAEARRHLQATAFTAGETLHAAAQRLLGATC